MHGHLWAGKEVVWPMQVVQVDIVGLKCFQALAQGRLWVLIGVVPKFGGEEDVISLDGSRSDGCLDTLAHLSFVHRDRGCVNVAVADVTDGVLDCFRVFMEEGT